MSQNDGYTRYTVRIPTPLYERVKAAAGEASVNAEIVATLEEAYPAPRNPATRLSWIIEELDTLRTMMMERLDLIMESNDKREIASAAYEVKVLGERSKGLEKQLEEISKDYPLTATMAGHQPPPSPERSGK